MATRRRASRQSVTGTLSDLQRRVRYLQNRPTPTSLGNHSVVRSAVQPRAISTDQIAKDAIVNDQIQADAIKENQLDRDSVTRDKIKNGEVVAGKLATDSVVQDNIVDGEVVDGKLGAASVNLINMKPNSVDNNKLTTDSVNFRTVATNAIGNENMLDNSVSNSELQNDSVSQGNMRNDSVGFGELQSSSVGNSTLQNGSVTRSKIGSGQVGSSQIENGAITTDKIQNNAVSYSKVGVTTSQSIVTVGLDAGTGISKSGRTVSVRFGTASNTAARGNHTHSTGTSTSNQRVTLVGGSYTFALSNHRHSVFASSSRRYKKDISEYEVKNLKKLLDLKLVKYKYKGSRRDFHQSTNKEWSHGYIAEDVLDLGLDELVGFDKEGRPDSLSYELVGVFALELLKEQQKEIDELRREIKEMRDSNAS